MGTFVADTKLLPGGSLMSLSLTAQTSPAMRVVDNVVPGAEWQTVAPKSVGYSSAKLEALRAWVRTQDTGSMTVIFLRALTLV
jgi:hypothetical protein